MSLFQDKSKLDQSLKALDGEMIWKVERDIQVKQKILSQINPPQKKKRSELFRYLTAVALTILLCLGGYYILPSNEHMTSSADQDGLVDSSNHLEEIQAAGFFWEITSGDTSVYILGDIMAGDESMYPLRQDVMNALSAADVLLLEIDPENAKTYAQFLEDYSRFQDSSTLKDHLSPDAYQKLDELLRRYYLRAEQFREFRPWYVLNVLNGYSFDETGFEEEHWLFHHLWSNKPEQMEVEELNSYHTLQKYVLLPDQAHVQKLEQVLNNWDELLVEYEQRKELWITGSFAEYEASIDLEGLHAEYIATVVHDRNFEIYEHLTDRLEGHDGKQYFALIAADNLVGEYGVIQRLIDHGYEVKRR